MYVYIAVTQHPACSGRAHDTRGRRHTSSQHKSNARRLSLRWAVRHSTFLISIIGCAPAASCAGSARLRTYSLAVLPELTLCSAVCAHAVWRRRGDSDAHKSQPSIYTITLRAPPHTRHDSGPSTRSRYAQSSRTSPCRLFVGQSGRPTADGCASRCGARGLRLGSARGRSALYRGRSALLSCK